MNIYLLSQKENNGYDTYDSFVVVAENEETAMIRHPEGNNLDENGKWNELFGAWASSPDSVSVQKIGVADEGFEPGTIICSSFNAG